MGKDEDAVVGMVVNVMVREAFSEYAVNAVDGGKGAVTVVAPRIFRFVCADRGGSRCTYEVTSRAALPVECQEAAESHVKQTNSGSEQAVAKRNW